MSHNIWVGLVNPKLAKCNDDDCLNILSWVSDGAPIDNRPNNQAMLTNNPFYCLHRPNNNKRPDDVLCSTSQYIVCEFGCDKGIFIKLRIKNLVKCMPNY